MRIVLAIIAAALIIAAGAFLFAGRAAGPVVEIIQPVKVLGQAGTLDVVVRAPRGALTRLDVSLEQAGQTHPLFSLPGAEGATLAQEGPDAVRLTRALGARSVKGLKSGEARLVITAGRPVLFGLREATTQASHAMTVRLEPPRVAVLSRFHFINHGGSEMVVYRVTPTDVESGVRVGDRTYRGFPASAAGLPGADASVRVAFFALLWDQDLNTPMTVYARDDAGNQARASFDTRVFPKPFRKSRIDVPDEFLSRVVPEILAQSPEFKVDDPNDLVKSYVAINSQMRRANAETIEKQAANTAPEVLWQGPFRQLTNSSVESSFADQRTYFYKGEEIDRQVHLGFDLAVTANVPISASNRGVVAYAAYLGIYGNCVIVDHGMGVQSLYAHLSSIDLKVGDRVELGQTLGRSGMTGLAGGDHLHYTMLVNGHPVNPVDWWSAQWINDRILRKLREAGAPAEVAQSGAPSPESRAAVAAR